MSAESFIHPTTLTATNRSPFQLRAPFLALVSLLLLAVGASVFAGLIGIGALDRSLEEVTQVDVQRLLTVTHVRRLFRSEVVLSHAIEEERDPIERSEMAIRLEQGREERAVLLDQLSRLGVLGQNQALDTLKQEHGTSIRHGHGVAKNWESSVALILNATQERLTRAAAAAKETSRAARAQLIVVSALAAALSLLLGVVLLRRLRAASESLTQSEAQFRAVVQSAPSLLAMLSPVGKLVYIPPRAASFLGTTLERLHVDPLCWLKDEERHVLQACMNEALAGTLGVPSVRLCATRDNETTWHVSASATPLFDAQRQVTGIILQLLDISEQCVAERAQHELEDQLRQAQKMETVGRLAGGIAHDFNNLLTAIQGYASLVQQEPNTPDVPEFIEGIVTAADRAAHLTRQLLAFSRKHVIAPIPTDLGALVRGLEKMLVRVIGEDVRLVVTSDKALGRCLVDPNQVEQVVMNLAINARHAMPNGGNLAIEVRNAELDEGYTVHHPTVPSGAYVLLAVSDTGVGMSKEVKERIFEPFFTTKPVGQGTGLGLSVVYGTVQQHGGTIDVYSELGFGTSFRIYWPRVEPVASAVAQTVGAAVRPRGSETVLLVEDELLVRVFATKTLTQQGYRVICAESAEAALQLFDEAAAPALLITDVILPGINGPALARELLVRFPGLPVLFASGYSGHLMAERGQLPADVDYLQKPFDATTLAKRVRAAIDNARPFG